MLVIHDAQHIEELQAIYVIQLSNPQLQQAAPFILNHTTSYLQTWLES